MSLIIFIMVAVSILFAILNGKTNELSEAFLSESASAVTLCLSLCGSICFWSGVMNTAEKSGLVNKISKLMSPFISLLFSGIDKKGKACGYIVMNIVSNLMGMGNASTPLGIKAMQELEKEESANGIATDNMIMLTIINTASLQLFPATVAAIRTNYNSVAPAEIVPCVWIVSVYCFAVSVGYAKLMSFISKRRKKAHK